MKRCSMSLVIREMQTKSKWDTTSHSGWQLSKQWKTTSIEEDLEKLEPSWTDSGDVQWHCHCGKVWSFFKNLKDHMIHQLYSWEYTPKVLEGWKVQAQICTPMFTAALCTKSTSRNTRNPSTDDGWTKHGVCKQWSTLQPWRDLTLGEMSQDTKADVWPHLHEVLQSKQILKRENKEKGRSAEVLSVIKKFWKQICWWSYNTVNVSNTTELYT